MDEAAEAFVVGRWADSAGEFTIKNGEFTSKNGELVISPAKMMI